MTSKAYLSIFFTHKPLEKALRKPPLRVVTKSKEPADRLLPDEKNSSRFKDKRDSLADGEDNPDPDKTG